MSDGEGRISTNRYEILISHSIDHIYHYIYHIHALFHQFLTCGIDTGHEGHPLFVASRRVGWRVPSDDHSSLDLGSKLHVGLICVEETPKRQSKTLEEG